MSELKTRLSMFDALMAYTGLGSVAPASETQVKDLSGVQRGATGPSAYK